MIPESIINLAAEFQSKYSDGWAKEEARAKLEAMQHYIAEILKESVMTKLERYWEYKDFPKLGGDVGIVIDGERLLLLNDTSTWVELSISQADKQRLLKVLLRDFLK